MHQIVHGDVNTVVMTEGGPVRSVAKLIKDNQELIGGPEGFLLLSSTGGAAMVGVAGGGTVQDALNGKVSQSSLAAAGGAANVGVAGGGSVQTALDGKATPADVTAAINGLVSGAPAALNTLKELADAINDDANYAATVTTQLGLKASKAELAATGGAALIKHGTETVADLLDTLPLDMDLGGNLTAVAGWSSVPEVVTSNDALSGTSGPLNAQAQALLNRIEHVSNALQLPTYAALRAYSGPRKSVYITGYLVSSAPCGIAGMFVIDDSDTTSADNSGTVIVATSGARWKRQFVGAVDSAWFGTVGDGIADDYSAIQSAANACPPGGKLLVRRHRITDEIRINRPMTIEGLNSGHPMYTFGDGIGIRQSTAGKNAFTLVANDAYFPYFTDQHGIFGVIFRDLQICGADSNNRTGSGIGVDTSQYSGDFHVRGLNFDNVSIKYFNCGSNLEGIVYINNWTACSIVYCNKGIRVNRGGGSDSPSQNRVRGCHIVACGTCIDTGTGGDWSVEGSTLAESNFGVVAGEETALSIIGNSFEALTGNALSAGIYINIADNANPNSDAARTVIGNKFLLSTRDIYLHKTSTGFSGGGIHFPMFIEGNTFQSTVAVESHNTIDNQALCFGASNTGIGSLGTVANGQLINFAGADKRAFPYNKAKSRAESELIAFSFIGGSTSDHYLYSVDVPNGSTLYVADAVRYTFDAATGARSAAALQFVDGSGVVRIDLYGSGNASGALWTNSTGSTKTIRVRSNSGGSTSPYYVQAYVRVS